jgi:hypothetical protein
MCTGTREGIQVQAHPQRTRTRGRMHDRCCAPATSASILRGVTRDRQLSPVSCARCPPPPLKRVERLPVGSWINSIEVPGWPPCPLPLECVDRVTRSVDCAWCVCLLLQYLLQNCPRGRGGICATRDDEPRPVLFVFRSGCRIFFLKLLLFITGRPITKCARWGEEDSGGNLTGTSRSRNASRIERTEFAPKINFVDHLPNMLRHPSALPST